MNPLRKLWRFLRYVWRDFHGERITVREAWMLAGIGDA